MSGSKSSDAEWLTTRTFLLLLGAMLFAAFPKIALGLDTFFTRDFGALGYPGNIFNRASFLGGELPLWNPYSHCGVPWLAQMGQWYPPALLAVFFSLPWAVNFLMLAHLWFGGLGMFRLLRRWNCGNFPAAVAAFAFVFNGVTLSCLQWGNYIAAIAWLPWVVNWVVAAWRDGGRWQPLAAFAAAMQVLTATPELTLLTWMFLGALWLGDVFSCETKILKSACRISLVVALAAGITMIQMLPFFDLLAHSQRSSGSGETAMWSMPGWGWANFLVPLFHCYQSPQGQWFQTGQDFLPSYYPGVGVLALAIAGAISCRNRTAAVIVAMILFCAIMALGPNGILFEPLRKLLPIIGIARFPVKFIILTAFLVPLLAAFALEQFSREKKARMAIAICTAGVFLLAAALLCFVRLFPFPLDHWNMTLSNSIVRLILAAILVGGIFLLPKLKQSRVSISLALLRFFRWTR